MPSNKIKVFTNVPLVLTFKYGSFKEWQNQGENGPYKSYSIAVTTEDGQEGYFSVYENEYKYVFSKLGDLKDRKLTLLKYEDGKYKAWKVLENGQEITPRKDHKDDGIPTIQQQKEEKSVACNCDKTFAVINTRLQEIKKWKESVEERLSTFSGIRQALIGAGHLSEDGLELHESFLKAKEKSTVEKAFPDMDIRV